MQKFDNEGVCFFAYNNNQIDYVALACLAAKFVKQNLNKPVALLTDAGSRAWLEQTRPDYNDIFDYIIETKDEMKPNVRKHHDSPWTEFPAQFNNSNKHKIFYYTPFEKTLLLDIDYIVRTDFLNYLWDTDGVAMFDTATSLRNDKPHPRERYLFDAGIKMWWSTVIYFDQSEQSKLFFDTWAHIADNYDFYQFLYGFPIKLFRTDYCVSIASHILNGMQDGDYVTTISDKMYYMDQRDDWLETHSINDWIMLANDMIEPWKNILVNSGNLDIHVMNKRALARQSEVLEELLNG